MVAAETSKESSQGQLRSARATASSAEEKDPPDVYIKNVNELDVSTLKCMESTQDTFIVRLKSDDESKEKRRKHINRIFQLCREYSLVDGKLYAGIEVRFEEAFPAYAGHFHPTVVDIIKKDVDIVKCVEGNAEVESLATTGCIPSRNWAAARISLDQVRFNNNPIKATNTFSCGNGLDKVYEYECGAHRGKNVTIYIIDDQGFLNNDFTEQPNRVTYGMPSPGNALSHCTMVANVAAGKTCGIAPEAKVWIYSPPQMTGIGMKAGLDEMLKAEAEAKKSGPHYGVLNISQAVKRTQAFPGDILAATFQEVLSRGIFTVVAAGNEQEFIDDSYNATIPQDQKGVFLIGASDKTNSKASFSAYGPLELEILIEELPGVTAWAPGTEMSVIGSNTLKRGTSFSAPHASGLLACLLSSELTQENANTPHWSIDAVRQKLEKSFSRNTAIYKEYNINTIYNNLKYAKEEFPAIKQLPQAPAGLTDEMVITGAVITGSDTLNCSIIWPPDGAPRTTTLEQLHKLADLWKRASFTELDTWMKERFKINEGTSSRLKVTRSAKIKIKSAVFEFPNTHTDGDGFLKPTVVKTVGEVLMAMLPALPISAVSKK